MKKALYLICFGILLLTGCSDKETLHVYTWSDYFDPELVAKFETENNCIVSFDTFDSNESMYAKLKAGSVGYDVMIPSSYQIDTLVQENLILPIDHTMISNVCNNFNHDIDQQVYDKEFKWSVPYACTYTGLMCLSNKIDELDSWSIVGDSRYKGKITLLDDIREVIGIGLMYNGYSLNSENKKEIDIATDQIIKWRKNIRKFDAESYKNEVADGSTYIGHGYSSDAALMIIESDRSDIVFILPKEGFTVAWDEFVISSSSRHVELAHKFIDFFYQDDNAYQNMIYICSLMANKKAFDRLEDKYKSILMPKNLEHGQLLKGFTNPETLELYNNAWDRIKAVSPELAEQYRDHNEKED